jgi:hypothetical protein
MSSISLRHACAGPTKVVHDKPAQHIPFEIHRVTSCKLTERGILPGVRNERCFRHVAFQQAVHSEADPVNRDRTVEHRHVRYFRRQTEASLRQRYLPILERNLEQLGFYRQYKQMLSAYNALPIQNKPDLDLEQHALTQSLNGLFAQIGEEEKLIRRDPLGRGSSAIAAVFGR